ncbi:dmt(drug/metabolite transporter) superfamily permease [Halogeometricum borinquense DSM 11551]|uniref:DMT(Drug/metabolite transporter) superfamily permease n=2 Tax=Halogeometricum borinquense TaxID=60847 RepID=E4NP08_HALBP|nr:EamA family transporter [Halogeometricum borinquense]ADQ66439.1 DMT(drug/metabolite transporter) superfamily permease [Halogeometricum borinquense DSM 11551]ELY31159.1 dmt(drug/metabolite transporter) superfamily permease [Halogeometricum borinquense DSM 11551]RYJ15166.1 EamA family transporter [Halogeometricum borinquense]
MSRYRSLVFFLAASAFFGGTFVAAKAGLEFFPPLLFVAYRFDIGAALLLSVVLYRFPRERWLPRTRADIAGILAAGVFAIGATNALIFVGQQYVTSGVSSIIYSLNPIMTPILAAFLLSDERLSRSGAGGMLLGLVGVALVVNLNPADLLGGAVVGKALVLAAAVSGALGSVLIRRADSTLDSTVRTAWALPVAAVLCHVSSFAAGEQASAVTWTPAALAALGYVGVFSGALAFIAYFGLLDDVGAIRGNLVFYAVPIVATLGGWLLLGETISALTVVGFGVICLGFVLLGRETITAELSRIRRGIAQRAGSGSDSVTGVVGDTPRWSEQD